MLPQVASIPPLIELVNRIICFSLRPEYAAGSVSTQPRIPDPKLCAADPDVQVAVTKLMTSMSATHLCCGPELIKASCDNDCGGTWMSDSGVLGFCASNLALKASRHLVDLCCSALIAKEGCLRRKLGLLACYLISLPSWPYFSCQPESMEAINCSFSLPLSRVCVEVSRSRLLLCDP